MRIIRSRNATTLLLAISATAGINTAATAQTDAANLTSLEEVIVTAERREADVQKIAASVNVQKGEDLAAQGRYSLDQILETVVGISGGAGDGGGIGTDTPELGIAIRGIRSNSPGPGALSSVPTTASYVDGVFGGVGGNYDIERVEVLRGPQGTLYGRSATGGVVARYTRNPNLTKIEGNVSVERGRYSLEHYTAAVNVPIIDDKLAVRVSGNFFERDGYLAAAGSGAITNTDSRIKILYEPTDDISVLVGYAEQRNTTHDGGASLQWTSPNSWRKVSEPTSTSTNSFRQYWAEFKWDLGPATLSYMPALRSWEQNASDLAAGPGTAALLLRIPQQTPNDDFITHEIHLTSNNDSRLAWQLGALYFENNIEDWNYRSTWDINGQVRFQRIQDRYATDKGVFAEATYSFTDSTRLTAGLRYDKSDVETTFQYIDNTNRSSNTNLGQNNLLAGQPANLVSYILPREAHFTNTTYKLRLERDFSPTSIGYAMVSSGFIPGDITVASTTPPTAYTYTAEELTAYEIGSKNRFFDDALQVNGAIYFYDYAGFQSQVRPDPNDSSVVVLLVTPAQMTGGEIEVLYQLALHDRIGFNYGYIDPRWVDVTPAVAAVRSESYITGIAKHTANLSYDHLLELPGGSSLNLRADVLHSSSYRSGSLSPDRVRQGVGPYVQTDAQTYGNVSANWTSATRKFRLGAYVRNVTDEQYKTGGNVTTILPGGGATGSPTQSDPRTWGITAGVNF